MVSSRRILSRVGKTMQKKEFGKALKAFCIERFAGNSHKDSKARCSSSRGDLMLGGTIWPLKRAALNTETLWSVLDDIQSNPSSEKI
jgi:hypothetical protein